MKPEHRRSRRTHRSGSDSPVSSGTTLPSDTTEDHDIFALARQATRDLLQSETRSRRRTTNAYTSTNSTTSECTDIQQPDAVLDDARLHGSRTSYTHPAIDIGQELRDGHRTPSDTGGKLLIEEAQIVNATTSNTDSMSVKSEVSTQSNIRTSGRRIRPSQRLNGNMMLHKDTNEVYSLPVYSPTVAHSISIVPAYDDDTLESAIKSDTTRPQASDTPLKSHSQKTVDSSQDSTSPTPDEQSPLDDPLDPRDLTVHILESTMEPEDPVTDATTDLREITNGNHLSDNSNRHTLKRTHSNSSLSSDLSDLSSISSMASMASRETVSSSGSNTIRAIHECSNHDDENDDDNGEHRQRIVAQALALTKKWKGMWLTLDKRLRANLKKQERNRLAREQLAAQKSRRR